MATYNGKLKDNNINQNIIHPETNAKQVLTGENNENNLQNELNNINDKFAQIKENEKNKGRFKNLNELKATYQDGISNPLDRAGWLAIVEDEDKIYFYDTEENKWKPSASSGGTGSGIQSVNGKTNKNIVLTGSDINATLDGNSEKTLTQHLQDIKDITNDIKQTKINNKILDGGVELTSNDITTTFEDGHSVQDHLENLENSVEELENELQQLTNKTNVLYLTNEQMYNAINSLVEPYENGQLVIVNNDGNYKLGSTYKFVIGGTTEEPQYSWEEITSSGGGTTITDSITLSKKVVVPAKPGKNGVKILKVETVGDYGFVLDEEDWFVNTNQNVDESASYAKITFEVPEFMEIYIDFYQMGENGSDYGLFSFLDSDLGLDWSNNWENVQQNLAGYQGYYRISYSNVEAGQHYITVKYVKNESYTSEPDIFKFKISRKSSYIPETPEIEKTSSVKIGVGDNDNIQANGKDVSIINEGTSQKIVGTFDNPITISELKSGTYLMFGYFRNFSDDDGVPYRVQCYDGVNNVDTFVKLDINWLSDVYAIINLYGAYWYGNGDVILSAEYTGNSALVSRGSIRKNEHYIYCSCLTLSNYAETGQLQYFKDELTKKIDSIKIIESLENPNGINSKEYMNKFVNSTNDNEDEIYYGKKTGEVLSNVQVNYGDACSDLRLMKSIVSDYNNKGLEDGDYYIMNLGLMYGSGTVWTYTSLYMYIYEGIVTEIYSDFGGTIYNNASGWTTYGDKGDTISLNEFYRNTIYEISLTDLMLDTSRNEYFDYMYNVKLREVITPIRLALYKDLNGSSGGGSISSESISNALGYTPVSPNELSQVATSGSYNDLNDKPTIPADYGDKAIKGVVRGYDGDDNDGSWQVALCIGLDQTININMPYASGTAVIRITALNKTYFSFQVISKPSDFIFYTQGSYIKLKDL